MKVLVKDLLPGDLMEDDYQTAMVISTSPHPVFDGLMLVVWKLIDRDDPTDSYSFDALSAKQALFGFRVSDNNQTRQNRWRAEMLNNG